MGIENVFNILVGLSFAVFLASIFAVIFDDVPIVFSGSMFILLSDAFRSQIDQSYVFDLDAGVLVFRQRFF